MLRHSVPAILRNYCHILPLYIISWNSVSKYNSIIIKRGPKPSAGARRMGAKHSKFLLLWYLDINIQRVSDCNLLKDQYAWHGFSKKDYLKNSSFWGIMEVWSNLIATYIHTYIYAYMEKTKRDRHLVTGIGFIHNCT